MENPLGLLRDQIYRLFNPKSKTENSREDGGPTLQELKSSFPWANEKEIAIIRKEKLYLDADFMAEEKNDKGRGK